MSLTYKNNFLTISPHPFGPLGTSLTVALVQVCLSFLLQFNSLFQFGCYVKFLSIPLGLFCHSLPSALCLPCSSNLQQVGQECTMSVPNSNFVVLLLLNITLLSIVLCSIIDCLNVRLSLVGLFGCLMFYGNHG